MKRRLLNLILLCSQLAYTCLSASSQSGSGISLTTAERLGGPGWWPTKGDAERTLFLDNEGCKRCHQGIAATQETTPMFHAGKHASKSKILNSLTASEFHEGDFKTAIRVTPEGVIYSVSDGGLTAKTQAAWAFGSPQKGQTYLLRQGDSYLESRLSYFAKIQGLDVTFGQPPIAPLDFKAAVGRKIEAEELRLCFGCHTTASVTSGVFAPDDAIPGVTCEACHGPGAKHVELMKVRHDGPRPDAIFDPRSLSPSESVDFCGACHRTWADVLEMPGALGVIKIRSQPYRLEQSRCWGKKGDSRLTCVACHDPHKPLVKVAADYDSKCLACHAQTPAPAPLPHASSVCKVADRQCVTCHMPKFPESQIHGSFTDHQIRIVPGDSLQ